MIIHIVLSGDAQHYLGLKSCDLPKASEIPKGGHFYSVWRMDLWPNELAGLPEYTDFAPLILTNEATRFSLLRVDSTLGMESFKGNVASYLQDPLNLGAFAEESYGRMEVRFYGGSHRSLATSMKDMRERAGQLMEGEAYSLEDLESLLNDVPLQFNDYETPRGRMGRMLREDPPKFLASDMEALKKEEALLVERSLEALEFTEQQGQFLSFIHHYRLMNRQAPTEEDMQRFFRITGPSVHSMVKTLTSRGLIERTLGEARSARVLLPSHRIPALEEV